MLLENIKNAENEIFFKKKRLVFFFQVSLMCLPSPSPVLLFYITVFKTLIFMNQEKIENSSVASLNFYPLKCTYLCKKLISVSLAQSQ